MEFLDLAKQRCTTRGFSDTAIPEEDLQKVLSVSRLAPSACNRQPPSHKELSLFVNRRTSQKFRKRTSSLDQLAS